MVLRGDDKNRLTKTTNFDEIHDFSYEMGRGLGNPISKGCFFVCFSVSFLFSFLFSICCFPPLFILYKEVGDGGFQPSFLSLNTYLIEFEFGCRIAQLFSIKEGGEGRWGVVGRGRRGRGVEVDSLEET